MKNYYNCYLKNETSMAVTVNIISTFVSTYSKLETHIIIYVFWSRSGAFMVISLWMLLLRVMRSLYFASSGVISIIILVIMIRRVTTVVATWYIQRLRCCEHTAIRTVPNEVIYTPLRSIKRRVFTSSLHVFNILW